MFKLLVFLGFNAVTLGQGGTETNPSSADCEDLFETFKVCSKSNTTHGSECQLGLSKANCLDDTSCLSDNSINYYGECKEEPFNGLLLGAYQTNKTTFLTDDAELIVAPFKEDFNRQFNVIKAKLKLGKVFTLYGITEEYPVIAVAGLGSPDLGYDDTEEVDLGQDAIRVAISKGLYRLSSIGCDRVTIDPCGDPEAAIEAAHLSTYKFQPHLKAKKKPIFIDMLPGDEALKSAFVKGATKALSQKMTIYLADMPANHMTPTIFAEKAGQFLQGLDVQVVAHDENWAEEKGMGSFLSVGRSSYQDAVFLEITYNGGPEGEPPIALVGKGITFDSGGTSLKVPSKLMDNMRADKTGGAVVVGVIHALASLKAKLNVKGFIPLTENMPGGNATKVNDIVYAMNGKSVQIKNTDAEGRLILADALLYAQEFKPSLMVDFATLTGAARKAVGHGASAVFTTERRLYDSIWKAGQRTGDRMWRLPLWKIHTESVTGKSCYLGDVCNSMAETSQAKASGGAAFLKEFVEMKNWIHLDIASTYRAVGIDAPPTFRRKGITGRPVRTVVEFLLDVEKGKVSL